MRSPARTKTIGVPSFPVMFLVAASAGVAPRKTTMERIKAQIRMISNYEGLADEAFCMHLYIWFRKSEISIGFVMKLLAPSL